MNGLSRRELMVLFGGALPVLRAHTFLPGPVWDPRGDDVDLDQFRSFSSILTGAPESDLPETVAAEYVGRLEHYLEHEKAAPDALAKLVAEYERIVSASGGDRAKITQGVWEDIMHEGVCPEKKLRDADTVCDYSKDVPCCLARDIIVLWYTSTLQFETPPPRIPSSEPHFGSAEAYLSGLMWKTVEGHPQGRCGGEFGYWAHKPGEAPGYRPR